MLQSKDELFSPTGAFQNPNSLQQRSLGSNNTSDNTGLNKQKLKTMFLGQLKKEQFRTPSMLDTNLSEGMKKLMSKKRTPMAAFLSEQKMIIRF